MEIQKVVFWHLAGFLIVDNVIIDYIKSNGINLSRKKLKGPKKRLK